MPYINVILKDGTKITVPDANKADWVRELRSTDVPFSEGNVTLRLICKKGEDVIARFNGEDIAGYVWLDGRAPNS